MRPSAQAFAADSCSDLLVFPLDMNNAPFVIDSVFISLSLIKEAYHTMRRGIFCGKKREYGGKLLFGSRYEAPMALSSEEPSRRTAVTRRASTILCYSEPVRFPGVGIPRVRGTAKRQALPPRIYEGGGPRSGRGSPPRRRGKPPQSRLCRASSPRGEAEDASHRSCPPPHL